MRDFSVTFCTLWGASPQPINTHLKSDMLWKYFLYSIWLLPNVGWVVLTWSHDLVMPMGQTYPVKSTDLEALIQFLYSQRQQSQQQHPTLLTVGNLWRQCPDCSDPGDGIWSELPSGRQTPALARAPRLRVEPWPHKSFILSPLPHTVLLFSKFPLVQTSQIKVRLSSVPAS